MKGGDDPTDMQAMRARAQTFGEPFKSAFLWMPEDNKLYANFLSYWMPVAFDSKNGRITLTGDAAHPMPFRKSGAAVSSQRVVTDIQPQSAAKG